MDTANPHCNHGLGVVMSKKQTYLGDGLYAEDDGYQIKLYTVDGNAVFLDRDVFDNLLTWFGQRRGLVFKTGVRE